MLERQALLEEAERTSNTFKPRTSAHSDISGDSNVKILVRKPEYETVDGLSLSIRMIGASVRYRVHWRSTFGSRRHLAEG